MLMALWVVLYLASFLVRFAMAAKYAKQFAASAGGFFSGETVVMQPILSGDPDLEGNLRANAVGNLNARFLWLVDEDDVEGQRAAGTAARENVEIITGLPPVDGENPKMAKLARALPRVDAPTTVVLDDDTVIGGTALAKLTGALEEADLVTGMPVFVANRTPFEQFVGGFVNGNAVLTYLPAAAAGTQRTINGMIYAVRTEQLRALGGFEAVQGQLTDDYAMAKLYENNGGRILQAPVFAEVSMTINDAAHCGRVMRRWFLFANLYLRENSGWRTILLTAVPAILPLIGLLIALFTGADAVAVWVLCLSDKAVINRILLWRLSGRASGASEILFEMLSDTITPLIYVSALIRPKELTWRNRRMALDGGRIRYR